MLINMYILNKQYYNKHMYTSSTVGVTEHEVHVIVYQSAQNVRGETLVEEMP